MMRSERRPAASWMKRRATSSYSMPSMRISVERITRETSDDTMMLTMNQPAILMPSGWRTMLTAVV